LELLPVGLESQLDSNGERGIVRHLVPEPFPAHAGGEEVAIPAAPDDHTTWWAFDQVRASLVETPAPG